MKDEAMQSLLAVANSDPSWAEFVQLIRDLHEDSKRLDWLEQSGMIRERGDGTRVFAIAKPTIRAAIDAARSGAR